MCAPICFDYRTPLPTPPYNSTCPFSIEIIGGSHNDYKLIVSTWISISHILFNPGGSQEDKIVSFSLKSYRITYRYLFSYANGFNIYTKMLLFLSARYIELEKKPMNKEA